MISPENSLTVRSAAEVSSLWLTYTVREIAHPFSSRYAFTVREIPDIMLTATTDSKTAQTGASLRPRIRHFGSPKHPLAVVKRVKTRAVVVVVLVRELLFLVTSVICVRIRGRGSEVTTTPYSASSRPHHGTDTPRQKHHTF